MKFFWKIFFSTMIVCICCFSVGSYFLINTSLNASLEQEINVAYELCDIVHYSLNNEFKYIDEQLKNHTNLSKIEKIEAFKEEWIFKTVNAMSINNINGMLSFRISDKKGDTVYSSLRTSFDNKILSNISKNEKGYMLKKSDDEIYIQVVRPTKLLNNQYYIEMIRDVSHIFANQQLQYNMFLKIVIAMIIIGGMFTAVISKMLIIPINRLTKATKKIAAGDFSKRIPIKSKDEFSVLSDNFNIMSDKLEEKISELKHEAQKQELFVASFSHELKTPLTSIIGYSDMLRSRQMDKEKISLCANYIFEEGKRLETLSMRLLEMVVLKKQDIKLKKVSTIDFFNNIKLSMQTILKDSKITFVQEIEPAVISIEPELMKTVCINILDNARKAVGKHGEIVLKGEKTNKGYTISFLDNGKGMAESELDKIMQAFYMVDKSRTRIEGGAGLGLAICDEILKRHKASISFKSKLNEGTCVTIYLKGVEDNEQI